MAYPNAEFWSALRDGHRVPARGIEGKFYVLSAVDCGELLMPTGRLVACDPFACMEKTGNPCLKVPPGRYRVMATLADVSGAGDGSHMRVAYATLLLDEAAAEASRRIVTPLSDGSICPPEIAEDGRYFGFPVDAGTACFADWGASPAECPMAIGSMRCSTLARPAAGLRGWTIPATYGTASRTFRCPSPRRRKHRDLSLWLGRRPLPRHWRLRCVRPPDPGPHRFSSCFCGLVRTILRALKPSAVPPAKMSSKATIADGKSATVPVIEGNFP